MRHELDRSITVCMSVRVQSLSDSHIHLSFLPPAELMKYFQEADQLNIKACALGGYDHPDWLKQIELKKSYPQVKTCFGLHPWVIQEASNEELERQWSHLISLALKADAIGEAGIDRFRTQDEGIIQKQKDYFLKSLRIAKEYHKPVVLHVVQAHEMALRAIDQVEDSFGIAHSFSGSVEIAREYLKRGFLISVGPRILGDGFHHLKDSVAALDLKQLLIESDAPHDLSHPSVDTKELHKVAEKVAELKGCAKEDVIEQTTENFHRIFNG